MKHSRFKQVSLSLLLLVRVSAAQAEEIQVGVILPLTGDFGYFGAQVNQGISIAVDELSAQGAKLPKLIFEDDKCLAKEAVVAYKKLVDQDRVSLVVGPACSASIQSVAPIAKSSSAPMLLLLDTGPSVASLPDPLYSFGFDPPRMARMLAEEMQQRGISVVGSISEDEEYALLVSNAFGESWKQLGGSIVATETVPVNSSDLRSVISKVLVKKPEAIFFSSAYQAGGFLRQLRALTPTLPVYGNDTMCSADTIESAGGAANGARCGNVFLDNTDPAVLDLRNKVAARFGKAPASLFYVAMGYDLVRLALKELGLRVPFSMPPLLGVDGRNKVGVYDITPSVLEIRDGEIFPVAAGAK